MNIVVVFPTELEAKNFIIPKNSNHSIEVLISGIGSYATIYSLTKYCLYSKPDMIIHAGICGAFDSQLQIGEVVQVTSDCFADVGVYENNDFKSIFDMNFIDPQVYPYNKGTLELLQPIINFLPQVSAVTINTITSTEQQKQMLITKYHPSIESMEGAAVHYVALQEKISCVHVRAISNYVGERDKGMWNIKKALSNLHEKLELLLTQI